MIIRSANINDAKRLLEIYSYYVENTAITFEYDVPSIEEFSKRIENILTKYPYLVLEENGVIQGYAYASAFRPRAAYSHCAELSIYIAKASTGRGYGKVLYAELEKELEKIGIINLYASIASPIEEDEYLTNNSEQFHAHLGFKKVGEFHKCGYKFGRFDNMIFMEKILRH
ncbi:MAG: N-acetyltransferase [Ruminococcaceae bacterium]|nr:N-acetyltransferase [Oscillospiraceae bacterium]